MELTYGTYEQSQSTTYATAYTSQKISDQISMKVKCFPENGIKTHILLNKEAITTFRYPIKVIKHNITAYQ